SRRRHTRFSRDWSSDVCSSDLGRGNISTYSKGSRGEWEHDCESGPVRVVIDRSGGRSTALRAYVGGQWRGTATQDLGVVDAKEEIGRASCRERVWSAGVAV